MNGKTSLIELSLVLKNRPRYPLSSDLIRFYQRYISPMLPYVCRFEPTCSEYAKVCFEKYHWTRAVFLSIKRLLRCHPYCEGGIDLVP